MSISMRDAALDLAAQGYLIFPLHYVRPDGQCSCGGKDCAERAKKRGKHPLGRLVPNGVDDATSDESIVARWWTDEPNANIGLACGFSFFVLDVDGDEGRETLVSLEVEHGQLPPTLTSKSGHGEHRFFALPDGVQVRNSVKNIPGLDTRSEGGYVVAPPSMHWSGVRYAWANQLPMAEVPLWLVERIRGAKTAEQPAAPAPTWTAPTGITPWAAAALRNKCEAVASAREGSRNSTLNLAAYSLARIAGGGLQGLDVETIRQELGRHARMTGMSEARIEGVLRSRGGPLEKGFLNPNYGPDPSTPPSTKTVAGVRMEQATSPGTSASVFDDVWRWAGEWGDWFDEPPPPRRYLLSCELGARDAGVLPCGRVGMLAAAGAAGKSWALIQLALSVATGKKWLGTYRVNEPGPVVLAMAEEEKDEIRRRLFHGARVMNLSPVERADALRTILPLPLCGKPVALVRALQGLPAHVDPNDLTVLETEVARDLAARLRAAGVDWKLIVLDPMSRFAGPDVEKDPAAATRFIQALERLTGVPGHPTVIVAHHTNQLSRGGDSDATAPRGSTALVDAVRWVANLDPAPRPENGTLDVAIFHVTKSNYAVRPPRLSLTRDPDFNGALRPSTDGERRQVEEARAKLRAEPKPGGRRASDRPAGASSDAKGLCG